MTETKISLDFELYCEIHNSRMELLWIKDCVAQTEASYKTSEDDVYKAFMAKAEEQNWEEDDDFNDSLGHEICHFQSIYPKIFRDSLFVSAYQVFEAGLEELAAEIQTRISSDLTLDELNGSGIQRALLYIEKVGRIKLNKTKANWTFLKDIRRIRNLFIHNKGFLQDKDSKSFRERISKFPALQIDHRGQMSIGSDFFPFLIESFLGILTNLEDDFRKAST